LLIRIRKSDRGSATHARVTGNSEGESRAGWHGFRRGLATNLYRLGVSDKTIQAIPRHANVSTTMNLYVKAVGSDAVAAMQALDRVLCNDYATDQALNRLAAALQ